MAGYKWYSSRVPAVGILLNALMAVWSRAVEATGAEPMSYADDPGILASTADTLQDAVNVTAEFEQLADQRLHAGKANSFCAHPGAAEPPQAPRSGIEGRCSLDLPWRELCGQRQQASQS